jgi:integrase
MARIKLKYVEPVLSKTGKLYYRFRKRGKPRISLPGLPGSDEFMEAYAAALAAQPETKRDIGAARIVAGTVDATIAALYKSLRWQVDSEGKPRAESTKKTDRTMLEALRLRHGSKRIATLEQRHVESMLAEKAGPAARRNLLRVLRLLLGFAVAEGMRKDNPTLAIKLGKVKTEGYHSWTDAEVQQYENFHPVGTKARLAFATLLYTAQRRSDVVRLGPAVTVGSRLKFKQQKTGSEVNIPIAPPLAAIIAATPMVGVKTWLVTEYGKPFTAAGFGNWFADRCNEAGLPQCRAHGLRKAFMKRMAEAGCSEDYIASISGHKDLREIRIYVEAANKANMADAGMAKTLAYFPKTGQGTE